MRIPGRLQEFGNGIGLFAQLMVEMFEDFAPDSFRVPTLNLEYLTKEYVYVQGNKNINADNLKHIRAEIKNRIIKDKVAKAVLGEDFVRVVHKHMDSGSDFDGDGLIFTCYRMLSKSYFDTAKGMLLEAIAANNGKEIIDFAMIVASHLKESYSKQFIDKATRRFFFEGRSSCDVNAYLGFFTFAKNKYTVYLTAEESIASLFNKIDHEMYCIIDRTQVPSGGRKALGNAGKIIKIVGVDAYDEWRAAEQVKKNFEFIASMVLVAAHQEQHQISSTLLVCRGDSKKVTIVEPALSDMKKRGSGHLKSSFSQFARYIEWRTSAP